VQSPRREPRTWWRVGFAAVCTVWFVQKLWSNPGNQWDFTVYYHSVQAWKAGFDPYDPASLPASLGRGGFKWNYPPYALGLFAPFAWLSLQRAMVVYLALKLVALGCLVHLWSRLLRASIFEPSWMLFLLLAYSSAIFIDCAAGNITTFEQLAVWIGVASLLEERYWPYVAAVVVASLLRLTLLPLLLVCLVAPDRRGHVYTAGGLAAFACIFLVTGAIAPRLTIEFFRSIPNNVGEFGRLNPSSLTLVQDVSALARQAYGVAVPPAIEIAAYLVLAAAIAVPTAIVAKRVAGTTASNRIEVIACLTFLGYALAMPRFKNYSYMLLIVPTYYIATRSTRLRQAVPLLIIACLPIYSWVTRPENITLLANYSQWLIALGAWGLYLYEIRNGALLEHDPADANRTAAPVPSLTYR